MTDKTKEFIVKAVKVHGDKYDYSRVEYVNTRTKVKIICKTHGEFEQKPLKHLSGQGCLKCSGHNKKINEDFIINAIQIHGDKYDYSKIRYISSQKKVIINCKIHGDFEQRPSNHLNGQGCEKCAGRKKQNVDYINDVIKVHGNKYDYSKVIYTKAQDKIIIICKKHGEFEQKACSHLNGSGCAKCGIEESTNNKKFNNNDFIFKAIEVHGNKYDYSRVDYQTNKFKVKILCKTHGEFKQIPSDHLYGRGCKKCGIEKNANNCRSNITEFVEKAKNIHGDKYNYTQAVYSNADTKILIICSKHGEFKQSPYEHLSGYGCPNCVNKTEGKLYKQLQVLFPNIIQQFKVDWCKNKSYLPFDFSIREHKIIIELDGIQHFEQVSNWKSPEKTQETDKYKTECANANGYSVIRLLQEDVFKDKYDWKTELVNNINKIISECKIQNIYMCKNNEYKKYKCKEKTNKNIEIDL